MLFKDNQKLTIISVSDFLATTIKREIRITGTVNGRAAYVVRGKRKEYYFDIKPDMLIFDGWSVPVRVDTETSQFKGNGCYNFVVKASPVVLHLYLLTKNLNTSFNGWYSVYYELENLRNDESNRLFTDDDIKQITNIGHETIR